MLNRDFKGFIQSLNNNDIRYLVVGGGVDFQKCFSNQVNVEIEGGQVNFIGLENLRWNKAATGRKQDLADLENLEKILFPWTQQQLSIVQTSLLLCNHNRTPITVTARLVVDNLTISDKSYIIGGKEDRIC